jgi:hypothetical protein
MIKEKNTMTSTGFAAILKADKGGTPMDLVPVVRWDEDGHALIVDSRAGRLMRASDHPRFDGIRNTTSWEGAFAAPSGWTVRWVCEGKEDLVDVVVGFIEDPGVDGGCPLLADFEFGLVFDIHEMLRRGERVGRMPLLMPPPSTDFAELNKPESK